MAITYDKDGAYIEVTENGVSYRRLIKWEDCVVSVPAVGAEKVDMTYINSSDQLVAVLEDESEITLAAVGDLTTHTAISSAHHTKYTNSEALAAAVQAGAITNAVTKAPTHDAVFDVKATADAAMPSASHATDAHTMTIDGIDVSAHAVANTGVHGIGASTFATAATLATHAALTATHGATNQIVDTSELPNKNAIINGVGLVNQRVTAYTLVKDTYGICADRFYGMATGTAVSAGTLTALLEVGAVTQRNWFHFSAVTLTGTGIVYFRYRMEAKDARMFRYQTASFSCKVHHNAGGAINYTVYVNKANAADNFAAVTAISNSGAISIPNATTTALSYLAISMGDCSNGIEIEIKVECGAITTKNFYFTELQFEVGSVATPFEFRPYQQELALCERYYTIFGVGVVGTWYATTACQMGFFFRSIMRAAPTLSLTTTSPVIAEPGVANRTGTNSTLAVAFTYTSKGGGVNIDGFTGATVGAMGIMVDNYLIASAEL